MRGEIPKLSIAFLAYSGNPSERRAMINGEMLKQGDMLAPGLSLEEIAPDGVILGYKGYRFRRGVR
jgi:general secretion pathway protein B